MTESSTGLTANMIAIASSRPHTGPNTTEIGALSRGNWQPMRGSNNNR
ncbi:Uncharacterised protein [Mycobacteroides abscessus]|nr:Uncharacterised protein [Mycobacteroides abscessus]